MKRTWTADELLEHFTLLPDELEAVGNKSGATRLGFAVLFKCFQYEGRFLRSRQEAAPEVVRFLATQVGVDFTLFVQYALLRTRLESIWGAATSTCASDSKRFHAVDQNLLTQWHAPGCPRLLACGAPFGVHLFAVKVLHLLRGSRHAGGSAAPLYRYDHQASDD